MPKRDSGGRERGRNRQVTVLGLDPGLRNTGYAIATIDVRGRSIIRVDRIGVICTEKNKTKTIRKTSDDLRRAEEQAEALKSIVADEHVGWIAMEMSTTTPFTYPTFSFGVMMGIVASLGSPIVQVLPSEIKKAVAGDERATKRDIISWAISLTTGSGLRWPTSARRNNLGLTFDGKSVAKAAEHPADALATIAAALRSDQLRLAAEL